MPYVTRLVVASHVLSTPIITSYRKGFASSQVDRRVKRALVGGERR